MQEHIGKIKAFLDDKKAEMFTGGIKMNFEEGKPATLWISDVPNFEEKPVKESFDLDKELRRATSSAFSGNLFFLFVDGRIEHFYTIETKQGRKLLEWLDTYAPRTRAPASHERRTVIAVRRKV